MTSRPRIVHRVLITEPASAWALTPLTQADSESRCPKAMTPMPAKMIISSSFVTIDLANLSTSNNAKNEPPTTPRVAFLAVSASSGNIVNQFSQQGCCTLWMVSNPVNLSGVGPPDHQLPQVDSQWAVDLAAAVEKLNDKRRDALRGVVAKYPTYLEAWAELGDASAETIDKYMAYRVGYHRGLDALRASGWKGSGNVYWSEPTNTGFLRCLRGLGAMATLIGETSEAQRCEQFLLQLDPYGPR